MSAEGYHIGTAGWAYDDWRGPFYPERTPSREYLPVYARTFDTVEVDSSFHGLPSERTVSRWVRQTPEGFSFAMKCPRQITHDARLQDVGADLTGILERARGFGSKLAAFLFQFPPSFTARHLVRMKRLFDSLPGDLPFAVEVRDPSWLEVGLPELARSYGVAWVATDRLPPAHVTADRAYFRWLGDTSREISFARVIYDVEQELLEWTRKLREARDQARLVLGYVNNHYSGHAPATASRIRELLGGERARVYRQSNLF